MCIKSSLPEGVAAGRGSEAPAARRAVEKDTPQGGGKRPTASHLSLPPFNPSSFLFITPFSICKQFCNKFTISKV